MQKFYYKINTSSFLSDTVTPVSIYLKIRDKYPNSILLESSDYHGNENSFSFICFQPISKFIVENNLITKEFPDKKFETTVISEKNNVVDSLNKFISNFLIDTSLAPINGFFGYTSFDAIKYFDNLELNQKKQEDAQIPEMYYVFYKYVIAINHFKNEITLIENYKESEKSNLTDIIQLVKNLKIPTYEFDVVGSEKSYNTETEFIEYVEKGKHHCKIGDVFQIVLSRKFKTEFKGDDFNVYRALRHVNPSPYLFYFDFGSFKLFGSSPEAQIQIQDNKVSINPIAGTFKRTGNDMEDRELAIKLSQDKKESSEHVMLVDLARNDLSRNCFDVEVEVFKEAQFYSHVIHLVSKVSGKLKSESNSIQVFADTFPAGTLSGAPKYKAIQLIDEIENTKRGFYGGAIGYIGFNGNLNHAILIRSFLSKNNNLYFQAGAGIVDASNELNELKEVDNKLGALRKAILKAKEV